MKRFLPWIITGVFGLYILNTLRPHSSPDSFNTQEFAALPAVLNGRVQPLDSVARNSLLLIQGKQEVKTEDGDKMPAIRWLLHMVTHPEEADNQKIFRIEHPELRNQLNLQTDDSLSYHSFNELKPGFPIIEREARRVSEIESQVRTPFDRAAAQLHFGLGIYNRLRASFRPAFTEDFTQELEEYLAAIEPGRQAIFKQQAGQEYDEEAFDLLLNLVGQYEFMARSAYPLIIPPHDADHSKENWHSLGQSLMEAARSSEVDEPVMLYAQMTDAYREGRAADFNQALSGYRDWLKNNQFEPELAKGSSELFYNNYAPFKSSLVIYIFAFLLGSFSLLNQTEWLRRTSFYLIMLALVVHSSGLIFRMVLEGRPPVTNLYSSAIFVGWGVVVLGLILESVWKNAIGVLSAGVVGFITLIIAHNLALAGDTMEMMRAVLDTNIWLATHVVVITLGYSAMFVAGFLAIVYLVCGVFTKVMNAAFRKSLAKMVYAIICFGTLFSFVGTVLGGIWADQSWGRFWGWDPKENGALLIVIWCAIILHARWGGMIKEKGLMALAIGGNIITAWSWFGVNMLGIGLHSYGFMDAAFKWLMIFITTQIAVIALAFVPDRYWRSVDAGTEPTPPSDKPSRPLKPAGATA